MSTFYRLQIKEALDPYWAGWFEGLTITQTADGTTILEGSLVDQATLYGLISKVRDLGLTLIAVHPVLTGSPTHTHDGDGHDVDE